MSRHSESCAMTIKKVCGEIRFLVAATCLQWSARSPVPNEKVSNAAIVDLSRSCKTSGAVEFTQ